jgi:hypothetical protein
MGPALARFDHAFNRLEVTSVKARARAQAIIARGQAYFDEWKEHLAGVTNQPAARAETERYARLFEHFDHVRQRSSEVRAAFRPFRGCAISEPASTRPQTRRTTRFGGASLTA